MCRKEGRIKKIFKRLGEEKGGKLDLVLLYAEGPGGDLYIFWKDGGGWILKEAERMRVSADRKK